jgi:hypothetical protein
MGVVDFPRFSGHRSKGTMLQLKRVDKPRQHSRELKLSAVARVEEDWESVGRAGV